MKQRKDGRDWYYWVWTLGKEIDFSFICQDYLLKKGLNEQQYIDCQYNILDTVLRVVMDNGLWENMVAQYVNSYQSFKKLKETPG